MSAPRKKIEVPTVAEVSVNWSGLARFLGWEGSISDLKRVELDPPAPIVAENRRALTDD
jgi:hypothetical protein